MSPVTAIKVKTPAEKFPDSPNPEIDELLEELLKEAKNREKVPHADAVKIIAQAITWQKVRFHIKDKDSEFNPDE